MFNWKKNLFFVWLSQFLSIAGFCFAFPFIPFYIGELGIKDPAMLSMWAALFSAAGNLTLFLSSPIWGFLSDVYGRRIMILRATFVSGFLTPLMAFVPGVGWLVFVRLLIGAFAGTVTASQILVSSNTPHRHRGFAMGLLSSAVYGGTMAGTFLGGVIVDRFGYKIAFYICGLTMIISGFLVLFGVKEEFHKTTSIRDMSKIFKFKLPQFGAVWFILLLMLLMGFATRFDTPFLPLLVDAVNGPVKAATWTGVIASLSAVAGILSGAMLGWLADRMSAPKVAVWSALFAGLLMIPQGLALTLPLLISSRLGMVFFAGGLDPVFQIWLAKSTPDEKRGLFFGWATSAKSFGWFLSSLAGGGVAMLLGVRAVYLVAAFLFLLLIPIIRLTTRQIPKTWQGGNVHYGAP